MSMNKVWIVLVLILATACQLVPLSEEERTPAADPGQVREELALFEPIPVLAARFTASESGYNLSMYRTLGAPTAQIVQGRAVLLRAFAQGGERIAQVSLENPREIHTAGADDPARDVLPSATFTVFFERPLEIRAIEIEVLSGPNRGFQEVYEVEPRRLKEVDLSTFDGRLLDIDQQE